MQKTILISIIILFVMIRPNILQAKDINNFDKYMNDWNEKRDIASRMLSEAELAFKSGDELNGCIAQRQASKYGIEATESLINALKTQDTTEGIENIKLGLNKWKELGESC